MILKTPNHRTPISLFFLTSDMYSILTRLKIPLKDVCKLSTYHQQLTFTEIAGMMKFQYAIAQRLGVPLLDPEHLFGSGDVTAGMIKSAFNELDSETLAGWQECKSFNSLGAGANIVLVLFNKTEDREIPGWKTLEGSTFSAALLETIIAEAGYLQSHLGPIVKPRVGEITLAEVYKLLGNENP